MAYDLEPTKRLRPPTCATGNCSAPDERVRLVAVLPSRILFFQCGWCGEVMLCRVQDLEGK